MSTQTSLDGDLFAIRWCQRFCQQSSPQDMWRNTSVNSLHADNLIVQVLQVLQVLGLWGSSPTSRAVWQSECALRVNPVKCSSVQFLIRISLSSICESRKLPRFRLFHTGRKRILLIGKTATWRIENHVLVDLYVQTRSAHSLQVKSVTPHRLITDDQHIRMLLGQLRNSLARQVAA